MPRVPYRYKRPKGYTRSHSSAASSIQAAWRKRNRKKKGGLVVRTAESNRRAINALRKSSEVKVLQRTQAVGPDYAGQWGRLDAGVDGTTNLGIQAIVQPWCGLGQGVNFFQRIGDWVTMHSLTYKVQVDCENAVAPLSATHNRVGMIIVLDTDPNGADAPNLNATGTTTPNTGTLLKNVQALQNPQLAYQVLANCGGPSARYKVLKQHRGIVQQQAEGSTRFVSLQWSGTLKGKYKIKYNNTETCPTNQRLLMFFYSDSIVAPGPTFTFYTRFRYKDT